MLAHNPEDFDIYKEWGADIIFAGHTHGGMIRILDNGIISTDRSLFPTFDGGSYYYSGDLLIEEKNRQDYLFSGSNMIVSRGLSRGHIGFRLFNRQELVAVKFN